MRIMQNKECNGINFRMAFFCLSSDVPSFKALAFATCKRLSLLNELVRVVDIPTQRLLAMLLSTGPLFKM